jgi:hypothetical protein
MQSAHDVEARTRRSAFSPLRLALAALALAPLAAAQTRLVLPPGGSLRIPQVQDAGGLVTQDIAAGGQTPDSLLTALLGAGVSVSNIQFNGAPVAAGVFSGGVGIVGFAQGIVLSSGDIASVIGPQNLLGWTSTDNLLPGDADLDALVGGLTQDACVLEFDFECSSTEVVSFQYVFSSEEYDEWVDTQYNDVFAFFLNGENIALIPGTATPVAINNVNCGNPWVPGGGPSCALYTTNDCDSLGLGYPCTALATEMDGITGVWSATGPLKPGPNHIKLVVADRGDGVYDTNVFIRGQSFACAAPGPAFDPPSPCGQTLHATVGTPMHFEIDALATSGLPGEAVILDVTGDPAPLAGGVFFPPLPVGPAPEVTTDFEWTPGSADVGLHHLEFTATDQIQQVSSCDVFIEVGGTTQPTWSDLGHAKAGSKGLPELLGTGPLAAGSDNTLELANGHPSSAATLVVGLSQLDVPFKGGVMVPQPLLLMALATNAAGDLNLPFIWPAGVPAGTSLLFQYWISDPTASHGLSASNGLEGVTQ